MGPWACLETTWSRSQNVIVKRGGNLKYPPLVFTEHGAVRAASVLNGPRAVPMSIFVVRAFLRLRTWFVDHGQLAPRLDDVEKRVAAHDRELGDILDAIRRLSFLRRRPDAASASAHGKLRE
jgi:hypothetical protein